MDTQCKVSRLLMQQSGGCVTDNMHRGCSKGDPLGSGNDSSRRSSRRRSSNGRHFTTNDTYLMANDAYLTTNGRHLMANDAFND